MLIQLPTVLKGKVRKYLSKTLEHTREIYFGGAQYLGEKYINAGQNTMYLQRFNVKSNGTYSIYTHQYMTNISGAASEAASTADASKALE